MFYIWLESHLNFRANGSNFASIEIVKLELLSNYVKVFIALQDYGINSECSLSFHFSVIFSNLILTKIIKTFIKYINIK